MWKLAVVVVVGCHATQQAAPDAQSAVPDTAALPSVDAPAAVTTIPITMVMLPNGNSVGTVQVSIGGAAPFTALLDTGSVGLRVVTGTVPDSAWQVTAQPSTVTYGSGVVATGVIATAIVTLGGRATTEPIAMEDITSVSCSAAHPTCPATGVDVTAFEFSNQFPAILGVGMRANANTLIASPIAAIGTNMQYVLAMPAYGGATGTITIDPDAATMARFTTRVALASKGAALPGGIGSWDDTQVPFCINAFCSNALLDTGQPAIVIQTSSEDDFGKLGVPADSTTVPPNTAVQIIVAANQTWSFEVGATPQLGVDLIRINGGVGASIENLGLAPFYKLDAFYDYSAGQIGLAAKP
jgi:hypothetical protein